MYLEQEIGQTCAWSAYTTVSGTKQIELLKSTVLLGVHCLLLILVARGCCRCTNSSPRTLVAQVGILTKRKSQIAVISLHGSGWHNEWTPSTAQSWKLAKTSLIMRVKLCSVCIKFFFSFFFLYRTIQLKLFGIVVIYFHNPWPPSHLLETCTMGTGL